MKLRLVVCILLVACALLPVTTSSQENSSGGFPYPAPFDKFGVGILSEPLRMALANQGSMLYRSQHVAAKGLVKFTGGDPDAVVAPGLASTPFPTVPEAPPAGGSCGSLTDGAKFNLEPLAGDPQVNLNAGGLGDAVVLPVPRDSESADFLYGGGQWGGAFLVGGATDLRGFFGGLGGSATLTAFHTKNVVTGTFDCSVEVEAATPDVLSGFVSLSGFGDPVIAADNTRSAIFAADLHFNFQDIVGVITVSTSIGLFRTTPASVKGAGCLGAPEGKAKNAKCWPAGIVLNADLSGTDTNDKPHMTVDERVSGTGAGDVYVTWTEFNEIAGNTIDLVACKNSFLTLTDCSSIVHAASLPHLSPSFLQFSHVAVRPANASSSPGEITITYIQATPVGFPSPGIPAVVPATETMAINYVKCTPHGAPKEPTCGSPTTIFTEQTPLFNPDGALSGALFRASTYPKHDHRQNASGGTDTFVVWDHCTINPVSLTSYTLGGFGGHAPIQGLICPNADVLMSMSSDDGASWSAPTVLAGGAGDQFFPWVSADRGAGGNSLGTINITYYDTAPDLGRHDLKVKLIQIPPTCSTPKTPVAITSLNNDPSGDFELRDLFYGDYIGIFARGAGTAVGSCGGNCRAYPSYTRSSDPGQLGGKGHGGTGSATVTLTETNNHVSLVTY